ncbi:MAG: hypothetical protein NZT92_03535 [Abditibacteriales bacterium]|nr:hypothetical protein [Abditibacteriales bacterium]MDW8364680.1 hypothetical protein [Abditibacteriales bacterium]
MLKATGEKEEGLAEALAKRPPAQRRRGKPTAHRFRVYHVAAYSVKLKEYVYVSQKRTARVYSD